jgi:thiamine kinase-like enzyme
VYDLYQKKFKDRLFDDSELQYEYIEIQLILEKTKHKNEKLVLCHGDLRRDNIISNK